jgi:hypothetical protein
MTLLQRILRQYLGLLPVKNVYIDESGYHRLGYCGDCDKVVELRPNNSCYLCGSNATVPKGVRKWKVYQKFSEARINRLDRAKAEEEEKTRLREESRI